MIRIMTQKKLDRLLEQERAYGRRIAEKNQMLRDARIFRDRICLTAETFEPEDAKVQNTEVVRALLKARLMNQLQSRFDELIDYSTEEREYCVLHKARVYILRVR